MDEGKEVRVWVDGCYDLTHFGHANMLRQSKKHGTKLIVGVHSDEDILRNKKRAPVFNQTERVEMVKAIKWADEVVEGAPYVTSLKTLDEHKCDFAIHGDDITQANGVDTYKLVKESNRYREVNRTSGISTTGLIKRILGHKHQMSANNVVSPYTGKSPFLQTTRKISEFMAGNSPPKSTDKVIYAAGTFDLLHVGHLRFLEKAKSLGDYLLVGLYGDASSIHGSDYPIMNVHERTMNLLANKHVNEVLVDPPPRVTEDLIDHFNVSVVCTGISQITGSGDCEFDLNEIPKSLGKFRLIDSESDVTAESVMDRIRRLSEEYATANKLKEEHEAMLHA